MRPCARSWASPAVGSRACAIAWSTSATCPLLELKLDPTIARTFGKDATKVITDAEGMLVDQEISGVDAGSSIERANRGRAELQDELDRVNRELSRPGLSSVV
jgi:hypothetical protein